VDTRCVFNENGDIKLYIEGHCGRFVGDPWTTEDEYAKDIVMKNASYLNNQNGKLTLNIILNFFGILGFLIIIVFIVFCMFVITPIIKLVILNIISNLIIFGV